MIIKKSEIEAIPSPNSITKYEYEGMNWIKENTNKNAIIASDRWYIQNSLKDARYFYYSTFSDRQFFLEGWLYSNLETRRINILKNKKRISKILFSKEKNNKADIMKLNNINYLVVSRFSNPDLEIDNEGIELLFENRDIKIYGLEE